MKEQVRDMMFYMHAQSEISASDLKDEIVGGTVVVPETETPSTSAGKGNRRKKKH